MDDLIAVRIKDGIFVGNSGAAGDKTFLCMNKITHVVNCAGAEVGDFFLGEPGFSYLSYPWKDAAGSVCTTILFDAADDNINRALQFIDEALAGGECVLVHSVYGKSRSPALIAAYLIVKYGWKLESALNFITMAHPDVEIKPHFHRQLRQFAKRHDADRDIFALDVDDSSFGLDNDQWMLRNTLLNGLLYDSQVDNSLYKQCTSHVDLGVPMSVKGPATRPRITFADTHKGTDTDSRISCPVVNTTTPFHADPATSDPGGFIGLRGTTILRTPRRSPSILSRSTSPCERHLESDPRTTPKGRQRLVVMHAGITETGPASTPNATPPPAKMERAPSLRGAAPASRTQSSSSHLQDRPKTRDGEADVSLVQPRQTSVESTRSLDYARLAPPSTARSPFAVLASSHKYRNGSPLPLPKKAPIGKGARVKTLSNVASVPSSVKPFSVSSVSPVAPPLSSAAARNSTSSSAAPPTVIRPSSRTSSPLASNAPPPSRENLVGRGPSAVYRGIAPSRSAVTPRSSNAGTSSMPTSPARHGNDGSAEVRSGSRRRAVSLAQSSGQSPLQHTSSNGRLSKSGTEERRQSRTRSPKANSIRTASSGSIDGGSLAVASGATAKNPTTVHRQLPPAIASRRQ